MVLKPKVIVVGAGASGLTAANCLASKGYEPFLFSNAPLGQTGSVSDNSGLNAALDLQKQGDSCQKHMEDSLLFGESLANQNLVKQMCQRAPEIIDILARMGVLFDRTFEGFLKPSSRLGSRNARAYQAGPNTGQQVTQCLAEQARFFISQKQIQPYIGWEFLSLILDDNQVCRGIVAQNKQTMEIYVFKADAVVMATGDVAGLYGKQSTQSSLSSGYGAAQCYRQGASLANCEFVSFYPYGIQGSDRAWAVPKWLFTDINHLWVSQNGQPNYFLEGFASSKKNFPLHQVARAMQNILNATPDQNDPVIYWDAKISDHKLKASLEKNLTRILPEHKSDQPIPLQPVMHESLGGLWVDEDHMSPLPGLFAVGRCQYQYHGACSLPGNTLLSDIYSGLYASQTIQAYTNGLLLSCDSVAEHVFDDERNKQRQRHLDYLDLSGPVNLTTLYEELGQTMMNHLGVIRFNDKILLSQQKIQDLKERFQRITVTDKKSWFNQEVFFARHFDNMLEMALAMTQSALLRNESRGVHYKPEYFDRDDDNYLKTTKVNWSADGPLISYEEVDAGFLDKKRLSL